MTAERIQFETKIAVVICDDLPVWQKLNMTTFLVSGIAATDPTVVGVPYEDGSGNTYLPMFRQPVLVFSGDREQLRTVYQRALSRELRFTIFTEELFGTGHDADNRAAVRAVPSEDLRIVGLAFRGDRRVVDKVLKGLSLHQ
jgi:hypothetical protein